MINKVFVNVPERCGSNYLCKFLQEEFGLFYVPPIHFLKYISILLSSPKTDWNRINNRFYERLRFFDLAETSEAFESYIKNNNPEVPDIIDYYFNHLYQDNLGYIPIFKENEIHVYFPLVSKILENATVVSQLRDPRMMWRSAKDIRPGFLKSKFGSLNATIQMWSEAEKNILFLESSNAAAQTFFLRYEDLVSDKSKIRESLHGLPTDTFPFGAEEHKNRLIKIANSSKARQNLTKNAHKARTIASTKNCILEDQHICNQLTAGMRRRGYQHQIVRKQWGDFLGLSFMCLEPIERIANRSINIDKKNGSKALYGKS